MSLYPTKTRLRLLRDVKAGQVFRDSTGQSYISGTAKVTSAMYELEQAGWVHLGDHPSGMVVWKLTSAGHVVLESGGAS
jgi:hypothetical protein